MQWTLILAAAGVALYVLSSLWTFPGNYCRARRSGFPLKICPLNPTSPLWMVVSVPLRPVLARLLPAAVFARIRHAIYGWEFQEKRGRHDTVDPVFLYVTLGKNELWIRDVDIANAVLTRRKDFVQSGVGSQVMNLFGPNVITSDGDDWSRHRKLIAPVLNERISNLVWTESCQQAKEMLDYFMQSCQGRTDQTVPGLRSIAINVLGSAGYGVSSSWKQEKQMPRKGHSLTYIEVLHSVINGFLLAVVFPTEILSLPIMPASVRKLAVAVHEFPVYTKEMLETERSLSASSAEPRNNFMSALAKASDDEKSRGQHGKSSQALTEDEIRGNLYLFSIAGFDTTANTLAYAVTLLAAYPEWQDWIMQELDQVVPADQAKPAYDQTFPNLKRCLAVMFETLRLYTPLCHIARETDCEQSISVGGRSYTVPAHTAVYVNADSMHVDPDIWGADALTFRPSRWFSSDDGSATLFTPPKGTFIPWSGGPRVCPGMKMAQVEFTAVISTIFRHYRAEPLVEKGQPMEAARTKLKDLMADSQPRITLQMNRPTEVKLRWMSR